ncbi:hypothetical protein QAD02_004677 [Eretmocerus hayati]|uniref:Uncharacterized protein n=1 Tax=Eretmocerus hayati TaxID=131215 RepID=A0ACC2NQE4_9HYME|nr:hypothetical protein QAD02_004677 [Eretmocerus hayati]
MRSTQTMRVFQASFFLILWSATAGEETILRREKRIYNGNQVDITSFPYYAAIEFLPEGAPVSSSIGGGSIISTQFVLTAAHVVTERTPNQPTTESTIFDESFIEIGHNPYDNSIVYRSWYVIRTGSSLKRMGGSLHYVDLIKIHPNFTTDGVGNVIGDIALVRVMNPFTFDKFRQPIPLLNKSIKNMPGTKAIVVGLGRSEHGYKTELRSMTVQIVDWAQCEKEYADLRPLEKSIFCAGDGIRAICYGDSGSPLVVMNRLAGIASFIKGEECGILGVPDFYTDVFSYRSWIESYVPLSELQN